LDLARKANNSAKRLAAGLAQIPHLRLAWPVDGNEVFVVMPEKVEQNLLAQGFKFYRWRQEAMEGADKPRNGEVLCRMVCSWQTEAAHSDQLVAAASKPAL
jgi:threonine aldolase